MKPDPRQPLIFDIHRYALDDGPEIRTTVFFKGCPLSCIWCHNPEGMRPEPELCHYEQRCIFCGDCAVVCPRNAITVSPTPEINRQLCDACGLCTQQCMTRALSIKGQFYSIEALTAMLLRDKRFYANSGGGVTLSGRRAHALPRLSEPTGTGAQGPGDSCRPPDLRHISLAVF